MVFSIIFRKMGLYGKWGTVSLRCNVTHNLHFAEIRHSTMQRATHHPPILWQSARNRQNPLHLEHFRRRTYSTVYKTEFFLAGLIFYAYWYQMQGSFLSPTFFGHVPVRFKRSFSGLRNTGYTCAYVAYICTYAGGEIWRTYLLYNNF